MKAKYVSEIIKQRRKELGVTQGMVCEGLCTIMTLSRFESGKQTPSWDCAAAILQRLGLPDDELCAHLTKEELRLVRLRKEVIAYRRQFKQALGEEKERARAKVLEKLYDLERCVKKTDRINQQFIRMIRAITEPFSPQNRLEMLMEAIRMTSPRFDLDKIDSCLYSANEIVIINQIAVTYSRCGRPRKAIDIYGQLLKLLLKRTPNHEYLPLIAYNYARNLTLENRPEEALEFAELARKTCVRQEHYYLLPKILHVEAECYYLMKETGKTEELYRSAYYIYGAIGNASDREILRIAAEESLNLVF